jgi:quinol monooxygenase YgiN
MSKNRDDRGTRCTMNTVGLLVVLEAKAGKEDDLASFLTEALPLVQQEPETTAWFAARLGPARFAIFDAFPDDKGRDAHLAGQVAAALMAHATELLAQAPNIEKAEILAEKLPQAPV